MKRIIGIDLGTSNSCVALRLNGVDRVIESADARDRVTPSVVQVKAGAAIVGAAAKMQASRAPQFTFFAVKRLLGRRFDDPIIGRMIDAVPFQIVEGEEGMAALRGPDRLYMPQEIIGHVLRKLRGSAEKMLSETVVDCVLACPAHFGQAQRAALRDAATIAGLNVRMMIDEPTAAAISYSLQRAENKTIAVYDLGGGTFDVSIMRVARGQFKVLGRAGDEFLGGEDFDNRIVENLAAAFREVHGGDPRQNVYALQRMREEAETAKKMLSSMHIYDVTMSGLPCGESGGNKDLHCTLTRANLEEMCEDLIERTMEPTRQACAEAKLDPREIDEVVLIGGMTAMPAIRERVRDFFGREPRSDVSAAEAVAVGAAIRGAAMVGELDGLSEPASHSIGLADAEGRFVKVIRRKDTLPREKTLPFTTEPGCDAAVIRVYEGELGRANQNRLLGAVVLEGVKPGAQIDVTFGLDEGGELAVKAACGDLVAEDVFHPASGLSAEDLARLRAVMDDANGL